MRRALLRFVLLLLFSPAWAEPRVYFASQDNIQNEILVAIDHATASIDGAVFNITAAPLQKALRRAAERGVTVRLLTDRSQTNRLTRLSDPFAMGLTIRQLSGRRGAHGIMHHKFAIFDGAIVVTGSYNWTPGAHYVNHENVLFEEDPAVVSAYRRQFEQLWIRSREPNDFYSAEVTRERPDHRRRRSQPF